MAYYAGLLISLLCTVIYAILQSPDAEINAEDVLFSCLKAIQSLAGCNADNQTRFGELGACAGT